MQVYWVDLPDFASSIENIQIQRGVGTSTNGSGAFGGSINILTNSGSENSFLRLTTHLEVMEQLKILLVFQLALLKILNYLEEYLELNLMVILKGLVQTFNLISYKEFIETKIL